MRRRRCRAARWASTTGGDRFFVNIATPRIVCWRPKIVARRTYEVPPPGLGLDLDPDTGRSCARATTASSSCWEGHGRVLGVVPLSSGRCDLPGLARPLLRAIGDPGVIDVIDIREFRRIESVPTESGAHTTALDTRRHLLYVFLPKTHRAAVFDAR
jgi:hypothetical protein